MSESNPRGFQHLSPEASHLVYQEMRSLYQRTPAKGLLLSARGLRSWLPATFEVMRP